MIIISTSNNFELRTLAYFFDSPVIYKEILEVRAKFRNLKLPRKYGYFWTKEYEASIKKEPKTYDYVNISLYPSFIINRYKLPQFIHRALDSAILYGEVRETDFHYAYPAILPSDSYELDGIILPVIVLTPQVKKFHVAKAFDELKKENIFKKFYEIDGIDPLPEYRKNTKALETKRKWYWERYESEIPKSYKQVRESITEALKTEINPYIPELDVLKSEICKYKKSLFKPIKKVPNKII